MCDALEDRSDDLEELVRSLQEGNLLYFDDLFLRFRPLIRKFFSMYHIRLMEWEDFEQEARIVMLGALGRFQPTKGLTFGAYYKMLLQHHIYNLIRRDAALKRTIDRQALSYEAVQEQEGGEHLLNYHMLSSSASPEQLLQVKESTNEYFESLSTYEREVFRRYLTGMDNRTIAEETGKTLSQVQNAYDRCRLKLMKRLL